MKVFNAFMMNSANDTMVPDAPGEDKPRRPRSKPWLDGRARSLAGIHGIAARPAHPPAVLAVAPTTSDIRKARQMAARTRALSACNGCKTARYHAPTNHKTSPLVADRPCPGFPPVFQGLHQHGFCHSPSNPHFCSLVRPAN